MADSNNQQRSSPEWQKIKVLGKGAFGEVSVWRELHTQQLIAVKVCPPYRYSGSIDSPYSGARRTSPSRCIIHFSLSADIER